jgi:hypothetical protein
MSCLYPFGKGIFFQNPTDREIVPKLTIHHINIKALALPVSKRDMECIILVFAPVFGYSISYRLEPATRLRCWYIATEGFRYDPSLLSFEAVTWVQDSVAARKKSRRMAGL